MLFSVLIFNGFAPLTHEEYVCIEPEEVHTQYPEPVFEAESYPAPVPTLDTFRTEQLVRGTFPDDPRMVAILRCESGLRQFEDDGTPVESPTRDFGIAQVNEATWDAEAKRLGLDYKYSLEDNLKMARHIYDTQGITAWVCLGMI